MQACHNMIELKARWCRVVCARVGYRLRAERLPGSHDKCCTRAGRALRHTERPDGLWMLAARWAARISPEEGVRCGSGAEEWGGGEVDEKHGASMHSLLRWFWLQRSVDLLEPCRGFIFCNSVLPPQCNRGGERDRPTTAVLWPGAPRRGG